VRVIAMSVRFCFCDGSKNNERSPQKNKRTMSDSERNNLGDGRVLQPTAEHAGRMRAVNRAARFARGSRRQSHPATNAAGPDDSRLQETSRPVPTTFLWAGRYKYRHATAHTHPSIHPSFLPSLRSSGYSRNCLLPPYRAETRAGED